jgi:hypothetical protein
MKNITSGLLAGILLSVATVALVPNSASAKPLTEHGSSYSRYGYKGSYGSHARSGFSSYNRYQKPQRYFIFQKPRYEHSKYQNNRHNRYFKHHNNHGFGE